MTQATSYRLRKAKFDWATFDSLPTYMKELCWEFGCHFGKTGRMPNEARVKELWEQMEAKRRKACAETYGADHPGAQVHFCEADFLL